MPLLTWVIWICNKHPKRNNCTVKTKQDFKISKFSATRSCSPRNYFGFFFKSIPRTGWALRFSQKRSMAKMVIVTWPMEIFFKSNKNWHLITNSIASCWGQNSSSFKNCRHTRAIVVESRTQTISIPMSTNYQNLIFRSIERLSRYQSDNVVTQLFWFFVRTSSLKNKMCVTWNIGIS